MITFQTPSSQSCLDDFSRQEPSPPFDGYAFSECKKVTRLSLLENQRFQCAFCEEPLVNSGDFTHLDHMEPQSESVHRRFDITNLVACCQNTQSCGHRRDSTRLPNELNPYLATNLHLAFHCDSLGELSSDTLGEPIQIFAFTSLNLNDTGLKTARSIVLTKLRQYTIATSSNARSRIKNLTTNKVGHISLHFQELSRFGYKLP